MNYSIESSREVATGNFKITEKHLAAAHPWAESTVAVEFTGTITINGIKIGRNKNGRLRAFVPTTLVERDGKRLMIPAVWFATPDKQALDEALNATEASK